MITVVSVTTNVVRPNQRKTTETCEIGWFARFGDFGQRVCSMRCRYVAFAYESSAYAESGSAYTTQCISEHFRVLLYH